MTQLEIVDRDGWKRTYTLQKSIAYIGHHPQNDVVLESGRGGGVAQRHVQLLAAGDRFQLVNLGDTDILLPNNQPLAARMIADVRNGDRIKVGDFTITFLMDGADSAPLAARASGGDAGEEGGSRSMSIALRLTQTDLYPDRPIEGIVTVRNLGNKAGVQFRLEVEGLETGAYEIGPAPVLFPNAQKEISLRLTHPRKPLPGVGVQKIAVHATAPVAYPGERAMVAQSIRLMPYLHHAVRITALD